jgi:hypothetical protein
VIRRALPCLGTAASAENACKSDVCSPIAAAPGVGEHAEGAERGRVVGRISRQLGSEQVVGVGSCSGKATHDDAERSLSNLQRSKLESAVPPLEVSSAHVTICERCGSHHRGSLLTSS